ncbi:MAG: hypothetical protein IJS15_07125 [Victivallales bacterium]|nr:hypothetical protein [Victivallales bacterium]
MDRFRYNGATGHRGNPEAAPENTLESFENAIELGCDFIETDVHLTRDGRLMLCHDANALRTCGVDMPFAEADSAELRKLDASFAFNHAGGSFHATRIPFLEEALELVRKHADVRISLQPKCPHVKEICDAVKRAGMCSQIAFNDGNLEYMKTAKREIPESVIFYDTCSAEQLEEAIDISAGLGFFSIVSAYPTLTPDYVKSIKAAGLEAGAWNVNDPEGIAKYLAMGAVRLYSDMPAEVLRQKRLL